MVATLAACQVVMTGEETQAVAAARARGGGVFYIYRQIQVLLWRMLATGLDAWLSGPPTTMSDNMTRLMGGVAPGRDRLWVAYGDVMHQ